MTKRKSDFRGITIEGLRHTIGTWVKKESGKPFKSGSKEDIVSDVALHPQTGRPAFVMASDGTTVEAGMCQRA